MAGMFDAVTLECAEVVGVTDEREALNGQAATQSGSVSDRALLDAYFIAVATSAK
jgi:hypothetical protein